jgi:hypothetical protein
MYTIGSGQTIVCVCVCVCVCVGVCMVMGVNVHHIIPWKDMS